MISLFLFFCYYFILRRIPIVVLQGVIYGDCDAVKMKDIIFIIENKVKVEHAKIIWRMLRVQALSLYMRHYAVTEQWEDYQKAKERMKNLLSTQKPSKKNKILYEQYIKAGEASEKFRAGEFEEARNLYHGLLDAGKFNMLNKVTIHEMLAAIDIKEGKYESAKQHLTFVAQNGGTTYMADEAREKLQQREQE